MSNMNDETYRIAKSAFEAGIAFAMYDEIESFESWWDVISRVPEVIDVPLPTRAFDVSHQEMENDK